MLAEDARGNHIEEAYSRNMEEGFGQASFKTFVLEIGLLSELVKGGHA